MKHGIEINGVANLHLILDNINSDFAIGPEKSEPGVRTGYHDAKEQLVLLERYMLAFADAVNNGTKPPYWHEVRENPNLYPTNRERVGK